MAKRRMTRKQIKHFGTKAQKAALKRSRKSKKKRAHVAGPSKSKRKKKRGTKKRVGAVTTVTKTKKRRISGAKMKFNKSNLINGAIHGAAAFGGGYASGIVEEKLAAEMIDDPKWRPAVPAAVGLLATMMDPKGPIGAFGAGMIGGAGRGMHDAPDAPAEGATVRGPGRRQRVREFRNAMKKRVQGMPDDRTVINGTETKYRTVAGPGEKGASYPQRNRF